MFPVERGDVDGEHFAAFIKTARRGRHNAG